MDNFEFRKLKDPPQPEPPVDGHVHIPGPLLEQLRALQPGQVLKLGSQDECYAVVRWADILRVFNP